MCLAAMFNGIIASDQANRRLPTERNRVNEATDTSEIATALAKGIHEFNRGEFFECHETLEDLWRGYEAQDRECIQGIIQIAVGYYHLARDNRKGALKLFKRGAERVGRFAPEWHSYDLKTFHDWVVRDIASLESVCPQDSLELSPPRLEHVSD